MFRPRLSVKTGCLRCKIRRKKCDEAKPACGYCARWDLPCGWSTPGPNARPRQILSSSASAADPRPWCQQNNPAIVQVAAATLDPFHALPVLNTDHRSHLTRYLNHFFTSMISGALPFDMLCTRKELAHGWARSTFGDAAVCYAFASYCALLQSKTALDARRERHALQFEAYALAALRWRLNSKVRPTERTILLASLHFVILAFNESSAHELSRVAEGIAAMVAAYGGYSRALKDMQPSTILSIDICDVFCSFLNATKPMYQLQTPLLWPHSLDDLYVAPECDPELVCRSEPGVVDVVRDMALILFLRSPSQQNRRLSTDESWYLFNVLHHSEVRLGTLQAQHVGTGTLSEIMATSMILVKQEIMAESAQHVVLVMASLRRLLTAVQINATSDLLVNDKLRQRLVIWACLIASVGSGLKDTRDKFLNIMTTVIRFRYGEHCSQWPSDWQTTLLQELKTVLWHARIEASYRNICATLQSREYRDPPHPR